MLPQARYLHEQSHNFQFLSMQALCWQALNNIIIIINTRQIPASKEPIGLLRHDGKRPDGATLVPWTRGRPLSWDVTVPDTFAASHIQFTSSSACAAADKAAMNKTAKYVELTGTHHFVPIASETSGAWCPQSAEFIEELGRRISTITNEPLETTYLFHRLSITLQRGNAVAFRNTFSET